MGGVKIEGLSLQLGGGGNRFDLWEDSFNTYGNVQDMEPFYLIQSATALTLSIPVAGTLTITEVLPIIATEAKSFMTPASLPGAINQEQFTEAVFKGTTGGANNRSGWLLCGVNDGKLMQTGGALNGFSQAWQLTLVPAANMLLRRLVNGTNTTISTFALPATNDKVTFTVNNEGGSARLKTFYNDVLVDSTLDAAGTVGIRGLPGLYLQEGVNNNSISFGSLRCGKLSRR